MPRPLENMSEASQGFDFDEVDRRLGNRVEADEEASPHDVLAFARTLLSYIRAQPKARITVDCLYLALGDAELEGVSMTEIAKRHGLCKAAISKRVKRISADLHLRQNRNLKSPAARETYRRTNCSPIKLDPTG